jgi:hypothetical protein
MDSAYNTSNENSNSVLVSPSSSSNIKSISSSGRRRASMFDPIDPTELQKTLYNAQNVITTSANNERMNHSGVVPSKHNSTSSDHSSGTDQSTLGTIEFALQYVSDCQRLIVDIIRIFDLTIIKQQQQQDEQQQQQQTSSNNIDILCKCMLLPDKTVFTTKSVKLNANPLFEEQFEFKFIDSTHLDTCFLEISLYELDLSKKSSEEICLASTPLIRLNYSNIESKKIFLKDFKQNLNRLSASDDTYLGELMFSLAYLTAAERLTIIVLKARNLSCLGGGDKKTFPDAFVKVSLISKETGQKLKKKKTSTQKNNINPVYNEEIVFTNIKKEQLDDICIHFTVFHDSLTSRREQLGTLMINSASKGNDYTQWKNMIDGKKSIGWWHNLSNQLDNNNNNNNNNYKNSSSSASSSFKINKRSLNFSSLKIK